MRTVEQAQFRLGQLRVHQARRQVARRHSGASAGSSAHLQERKDSSRALRVARTFVQALTGALEDRACGRFWFWGSKVWVAISTAFTNLQHRTVRQGHGDFADDAYYQTVVDNISLLTPELLAEVQKLVVKTGHEVAKKTLAHPCDVIRSSWKPMSIIPLILTYCGSAVREAGRAARKLEVGGWRQSEKLSRKVHKLFNRVRGRRKRQETDVRAYLMRFVG